MQLGICRICGNKKELSFEHVPPRIAFNKSTRHISVPFDEYTQSDNPLNYSPKGKILQGGIGYYSLCRECNSFLGRNYVLAYEKWVISGFQILSKYDFNYLEYIAFELEPLKILKQIISMFLAMNDDWYLQEYPELAAFVKDPNSNYLPEKYRVFAYMNNEGRYRYSAHNVSSIPNLGIINSTELTFPPFGYVLTMGFDKDINLFKNITNFKDFPLSTKSDINLNFHKLPTYLAFPPLDYRTKENIEKDIKAGLLSREKLKKQGYEY